MKRLRVKPRENYEERLTEVGFNYYNLKSDDDTDYWQESVMYGFSEREIDFIQESTQELHNMAIDMVSRIVKSGDYPEYFELNDIAYRDWETDQKSTRLNSSHSAKSRMPSSA